MKTKKNPLGRRGFLKGAAGAAALAAKPEAGNAQQAPPGRGNATAPVPTGAQLAAEARPPARPLAQVIERPGSDFMVDVLKTLDIDYLCANPGSTFESLHESLINYGGNQSPEFLTCCHE